MKRFSLVFAAPLAVVSLSSIDARASSCGYSPSAGIDWSECSKKSLMLEESDFTGANLTGTDFTLTGLRGSSFANADLEKATLIRAWLEGAKADKARFDKVEGYRSVFRNISANSASFVSAELQRADFTGAQLVKATFAKAELGRANFWKAKLGDVRFSLANLSRASLVGADVVGPMDFENAFLFLTRIEGVDLSKATGLDQAQVNLACGDAATKLPQGLTAPPNWPCPKD